PGIRQPSGVDRRSRPADEIGPAGDANPALGDGRRVLGAATEERDLGDPREMGGEQAADDAASDHPDAFGHGVPPARIVASFAESMFPPETTHTTLPAPPWPASAAVSDSAPAPSATTRTRSASSRTASAVSATGTAKAPSSTRRASSHIFGSTAGEPEPSTNDGS